MKIIYLTNARLPTEKAHGLATVKLCAAFAAEGADVLVVAPRRINSLKGSLFEYYRVPRNFQVRFLPSLDFLWFGFGKKFFFAVQLFSFSVAASLWLWLRYGSAGLRDAVIFSHDHIPLFFASFAVPKIFYDIHHYPEKTAFYERVLKRSLALGVQTRWKMEKLVRDFGVPAEKVIYWPNGTDIERFDIAISREEARQRLSLSQDKKIALYAGSLEKWKGVKTLVHATRFLSGTVAVYIIGGDEQDIQRLKTLNPKPETRNPVFVGQRPWAEIPLWLKAADVLVLPNTGGQKVALYYTSPMKLFEYMASGRPIVASDIPSIREIVDDSMVFFAEADNPRSFAAAIERAFSNIEEASERARRARLEVKKYTWEARAKKILGGLA